jgi:hypothetical protein
MSGKNQEPATLPPFWITSLEGVASFFDGCAQAEVRDIGQSAGGRPILAAAYGGLEPRERRMPCHTGVALGEPTAYFGEPREKPVLLIASTVHGAEIEGTVACVNFAHVMETGEDLRGKAWPRLREAAEQFRVVLIPIMSPDGRIHAGVESLVGYPIDRVGYHAQGRWKDGSPINYSGPYHNHPLRKEETSHIGGYFNDHGINLMYDDWFGPNHCPETDAYLKLAHEEAPNCVLNLHSCQSGPFFNPGDQFIPEAFRQRQNAFSELVALRLHDSGLRPQSNRPTLRNLGLCLYNVWYFVCGCLPLTFEFPHGTSRKPFTHDEILDIGLIMFEEVMVSGLRDGFRPKGWKWNRGGREW